jgi:hypothetical protein
VTDLPPALRSLLEGKNSELKQRHLAARVGDYQGSRVQAVRDVLDGWAPQKGTSLHTLWTQIQQATELYTAEINAIHKESYRSIPGVTDPDHRTGDEQP